MLTQANTWIPSADLNQLNRTLVIIPTFRTHILTHAVIEDCCREPVRICVIDNSGDYQVFAGETVIRPDENLGWLRANNLAMERALQERRWERVVLLNNDVRLSKNFFAGIVWTERQSGASIVAASYDDFNALQRPEELADGQTLDAGDYSPQPVNVPIGACDGTAVSVRTDALRSLGFLDEEQFGRYGWGGMEDFCFRARASGLTIVAARAAYVHHIGGGHQTAKQVVGSSYVELAGKEGRSGMSEKWGKHWRLIRNIPTQVEVDAYLQARFSEEAALRGHLTIADGDTEL